MVNISATSSCYDSAFVRLEQSLVSLDSNGENSFAQSTLKLSGIVASNFSVIGNSTVDNVSFVFRAAIDVSRTVASF